MLYIVPTPIGNLKDITLRALEALQTVDGIITEDSRHTSILLHHFKISKPILVLNDYNEASLVDQLVLRLLGGENLALVSDAGTPLISDPGYKLVSSCIKRGVVIDSLPGATAIIPALTLSSLPPDKFIFLGYLPEKPGKRAEMIKKILQMDQILSATFIILVSPHKLISALEELNQQIGDIPICLAKELTKIHQQVKTQIITAWLFEFKSKPPKGEYILLFNLRTDG